MQIILKLEYHKAFKKKKKELWMHVKKSPRNFNLTITKDWDERSLRFQIHILWQTHMYCHHCCQAGVHFILDIRLSRCSWVTVELFQQLRQTEITRTQIREIESAQSNLHIKRRVCLKMSHWSGTVCAIKTYLRLFLPTNFWMALEDLVDIVKWTSLTLKLLMLKSNNEQQYI